MTQKEKAKELYNKFLDSGCMDTYAGDQECAKQCALIAVDEILEERTPPWIMSDKRFNYWEGVKREIEKL